MAKNFKMTFHIERLSESGEYTLRDEFAIVDDTITTMTDVAMYMAEHAVGFKSYTVEAEDE